MRNLIAMAASLFIGIAATVYFHDRGDRNDCEARDALRIGSVLQTYGCAPR